MQQKLDISKEKHKNDNFNIENIPELRFKEFNENYTELTLKELCSEITNGFSGKQVINKTEYPVSRIETISSGKIDYNRIGYVEQIDEKYRLQKGDLLLTNINSIKWIGNTVYFEDESPLYHGMNLMLLRSKDMFNSKFIYYYIIYHKKWFEKMACQAVNQASINKSTLQKFKIKIPCRKEQEKIANFLSLIDKKIELLEKTLVLYQKHLESLRFKLMHDKNLSTDSFKLKEICEIKKGKQLNKSDMIENGKYYVLNGGKEPSGFTDMWNVKENTITISEGGNSCGFISFNTQKFFCGGHCYYLNPIISDINLDYLFNYLKSIEPKIMKLRVGSGLPNIQKRDIEVIKLNIPSLSKQASIGKLLNFYNLQLNSKNQELFLLNDFKKGLLQKMFI